MVVTVRKVSQIPPPTQERSVALQHTITLETKITPVQSCLTFNTVQLFEIVPKTEKLRNNHYKLKVYLNLNSFNPETQA